MGGIIEGAIKALLGLAIVLIILVGILAFFIGRMTV
jgi:hypothetical protein